jgi:threonine dehydrogenase-like Zn-dependent dehydrogenase
MKALVYTGPHQMAFRDAPDPVAGTGDYLIRIDAVGICGSDMHAWHGHDDRRPAPLILGHEGAGTIIGGARDGERVTINPLVTCMDCPACKAGRENLCAKRQIISMPPREGAFAQFVAMPERNLVTVPDTVAIEHAALAEPLAVSWHSVRLGVQAIAGQGPDQGLGTDCALVIGGGAIGLAAALALVAQGVGSVVLTEPSAARRDYLIRQAGIDARAPDRAGDTPYDLVIDAVGIGPTRAAASRAVRPGGAIVHIGLGGGAEGLDIRRITLQEITVIGTYTYTMQDFRDTCAALFDGRLGALSWTESRALSDGAQAFTDLDAGLVAAPKIILHPH